jgi:adenylyltransferase/sulfurtransferase
MSESRYNRQILVDGIGEDGQKKIREARVAVVGVGALGCAISDQISRAGVRSIRLIDHDVPEISNIQRQVLIDEENVRQRTPKALAASAKLQRANSEVAVEPLVVKFEADNADDLLKDIDFVFDGTDNFKTRYLLNQRCFELGLPWFFGGVLGMSGLSFPILPGGPCLQCVLGPRLPDDKVPTTSERGVLSSIVATIASIEVVRALRTMVGDPPSPNLIVIDLHRESFRVIEIGQDENCPVCGNIEL